MLALGNTRLDAYFISVLTLTVKVSTVALNLGGKQSNFRPDKAIYSTIDRQMRGTQCSCHGKIY